MRTDMD